MPAAQESDPKVPVNTDRAVRRVRESWRRLTGSGRDDARETLVACSGGADSSALLIALSGVSRASIVAAHIVHPIRSEAERAADLARTRALAERCGVPCVSGHTDAPQGNVEGGARRLRYDELQRLAESSGLRFVATGHHGDDQAETVLMRLIRGAGPPGMAGIRASRPLGSVRLIRPMLGITRRETEAICRDAGWEWATDKTNVDTSRLRNRLRADVMPALRRIDPDLGPRLARQAWVFTGAAEAVRRTAEPVLDGASWRSDGVTLDRQALRELSPAVRGEVLRLVAARLKGPKGADQRTGKTLAGVVRAIDDDSREPRSFQFRGMRVRLTGATLDAEAISLPNGATR